MKPKKRKHGGPRPGAGRPPLPPDARVTPPITVSVRLHHEELENLLYFGDYPTVALRNLLEKQKVISRKQ